MYCNVKILSLSSLYLFKFHVDNSHKNTTNTLKICFYHIIMFKTDFLYFVTLLFLNNFKTLKLAI